jgi:hypothetical protein
MFKRDRWWIREIERLNREHAHERALLVQTIARLSGKPDPNEAPPVMEPAPEPDTDFDPYNPDLG